ncbi:MAG: type II secretion system major pseudopilin GspG [Planctomycetota bacterium]
MKRRPRRNRRSAFTLLELLLVMAILVVLASLSTVAILSMQSSAYQRAAYTDITTLSNACKMYKLNVGSFPTDLNDLFQLPSGLSQAQWQGPYIEQRIDGDPWNRPYTYTADEINNRVTITSNGPDGQAGTDDDVTNAQ